MKRSDNEFLKQYFSGEWAEKDRTPSIMCYSGALLASMVKEGESVLDAGCGTNEYKKLLPDVYGIDITDIGCDEVCAIEDFKSDRKFDVAFCLGSINFGDEAKIRSQIEAVVAALKPTSRIYWRCNPGNTDHGTQGVHDIDFFPWTLEWHEQFAKDYGFRIRFHAMERWYSRLYVEWERV